MAKEQKPGRKRRWPRIVGGLVAAAAVVGGSLFGLMLYKDWSYYQSPVYERDAGEPADVVVVYYSRSGHTENMAREIARFFSADVVRITTDAYPQDWSGWRRASSDASERVLPEIDHEPVDLSRYRLIFIGSPIWWYRPSPPLWRFVDDADFADRPVVLFNTYNSRFKDEEIEAFRDRVAARHGRMIDHIQVRRGRITWQLTGEEVRSRTRAQLRERQDRWREILGAE